MFNIEFLIGDIFVPFLIFVLGFFSGKTYEKRAKAKIKGNNNTVIQNSEINKTR